MIDMMSASRLDVGASRPCLCGSFDALELMQSIPLSTLPRPTTLQRDPLKLTIKCTNWMP